MNDRAGIDFNEASRLCHEVQKDLYEMLASVRDKSFYDIGFDIGQIASGGQAYESFIPEFEELQRHIEARDPHALERIEWSLCDLVNHYDTLYEHIHSRKEHYKKGNDLIERVRKWRSNASKLAQMVCQLED